MGRDWDEGVSRLIVVGETKGRRLGAFEFAGPASLSPLTQKIVVVVRDMDAALEFPVGKLLDGRTSGQE